MLRCCKTDVKPNAMHRSAERCTIASPIADDCDIVHAERMFNDDEHFLPLREVQQRKARNREEGRNRSNVSLTVAHRDKTPLIGKLEVETPLSTWDNHPEWCGNVDEKPNAWRDTKVRSTQRRSIATNPHTSSPSKTVKHNTTVWIEHPTRTNLENVVAIRVPLSIWICDRIVDHLAIDRVEVRSFHH